MCGRKMTETGPFVTRDERGSVGRGSYDWIGAPAHAVRRRFYTPARWAPTEPRACTLMGQACGVRTRVRRPALLRHAGSAIPR